MVSYSNDDRGRTVLLFADDATEAARLADMVGALDRPRPRPARIDGGEAGVARTEWGDVVLVDATDAEDGALERLLDALDIAARERGVAGVVSVARAQLDLAAARLGGGGVELQVEPAAAERMAAVALAFLPRAPTLADPSRDAISGRLREISAEVGRIAQTLAALSVEPSPRPVPPALRSRRRPFGAPRSDGVIDPELIRGIVRSRRLRDEHFPGELFADPAWDMMLDLAAARIEGLDVSVSSLCIASAVPPTTALRWIKTLTQQGVFVRVSDPSDGRRVFITLSDESFAAMHDFLAALQSGPPPV